VCVCVEEGMMRHGRDRGVEGLGNENKGVC